MTWKRPGHRPGVRWNTPTTWPPDVYPGPLPIAGLRGRQMSKLSPYLPNRGVLQKFFGSTPVCLRCNQALGPIVSPLQDRDFLSLTHPGGLTTMARKSTRSIASALLVLAATAPLNSAMAGTESGDSLPITTVVTVADGDFGQIGNLSPAIQQIGKLSPPFTFVKLAGASFAFRPRRTGL